MIRICLQCRSQQSEKCLLAVIKPKGPWQGMTWNLAGTPDFSVLLGEAAHLVSRGMTRLVTRGKALVSQGNPSLLFIPETGG